MLTLNQKLDLAGVKTIKEGKDTYLVKGDIKILRPQMTLDIEAKLNKLLKIELIKD